MRVAQGDRINIPDQIAEYCKWAKESNLTHVHVYPPNTKDKKYIQARLRDIGLRLLEI